MADVKSIVVYGAGGLAREVEWIIHRINQVQPRWEFAGYVVTDRSKLGEHDSADKVVGEDAWLLQQRGMHVAIGIGTPQFRLSIGDRLIPQLGADRFPALVDPSAVFDDRSCVFEPGAIVAAGNMLTCNIRLKRFSYLNLDCTVGHETVIGAGCVINPSVNLSGGIVLGDGCLVGTGAQILQYLNVGDGSTVGAGALVTKNVEPGSTVVGVPAKAR